jgi:heme-degrading monooxygenase HmoA
MNFIASTPPAPYYAVIFSSTRTSTDEGYEDTADRMVALAKEEEGFLGIESARDNEGHGITVSYWRSLEDIKQWKAHTEHIEAQLSGRKKWYSSYKVRIVQVMRDYDFTA